MADNLPKKDLKLADKIIQMNDKELERFCKKLGFTGIGRYRTR